MPEQRQGKYVAVFVRLTPAEKEVLLKAVRLRYDNIHGALQAFCRRALLAYALATIRKHEGTGKK